MAKKQAGSSGEPNKSQFIRDLLRDNARTKPADASAAWASAGHGGEIKPTLFYIVRGRMKKRRRKGGRRAKAKGVVAAPQAPVVAATDTAKSYLSLERAIEGLVGQAEGIKDARLVEALRNARRMASAKLI